MPGSGLAASECIMRLWPGPPGSNETHCCDWGPSSTQGCRLHRPCQQPLARHVAYMIAYPHTVQPIVRPAGECHRPGQPSIHQCAHCGTVNDHTVYQVSHLLQLLVLLRLPLAGAPLGAGLVDAVPPVANLCATVQPTDRSQMAPSALPVAGEPVRAVLPVAAHCAG